MSNIIPAEQILKGTNAQEILELFGDSLTSASISAYMKFIPEANKNRLSKYDSLSIETDINEDNLKKEIEKLKITQEKEIDLANLKTEYSKFSGDILTENRFEKIVPTTIIGVGVDGSGNFPLNHAEENIDIRKIENEAQIQNKWNPLYDDGEDYLKESAKNVCFWHACNVAQLPIGTPVEICSAVIELLSPVKGRQYNTIKSIELRSPFNGKEFLERRPEINGLQYLVDGNTLEFEIENKNVIINGKKDFEKQNFQRFGLNGSKLVQIFLNCANTDKNTKFQADDNKLLNELLLTSLQTINKNEASNKFTEQRASVLFLFTIFFEYACYIFNIYNDFLIKKINKKSKEVIEYLKKANFYMFYNFILLINYSLIRKFKIKNKDDTYYDANDFIYVEESTTSNPNPLAYNKNAKLLFKIARRISSNEIKMDSRELKNNIIIYFKQDLYKPGEWNVDESEFTRDNFPISFNTDIEVNSKNNDDIYDVNYEKTIKKLTSFLLQDNNGEIPKVGENQVIAVGAPFQNQEVFKQTFEALDAYYDFIRISKRIYTEYAQQKIDIYRSSYTEKEIKKWYKLFMEKFTTIFTSYTNLNMQKTEALRVVDLVIAEYKKLRAEELRYMESKTTSKKNIFDTSNDRYRAIMRVKYGLAAEMIIKIAELTYLIYQSKNPGTPSIFISELYDIKSNVDKELYEKTKKLIESQRAILERKLGKNSTKTIKIPEIITGINNLPPTPAAFTAKFNSALSQYGFSIKGVSLQTPGARDILPVELRIKVENIKFWQDLRKLFNGRTILIPVAKTVNNRFNDNKFYLVDIFKSILYNKLKIFKITKNDVIDKKFIDSYIINNSYIMMTVSKTDLANPIAWRCINYNNISKLLTSDDTFINVKETRGAFFNLIANNSVLTNLMNVEIPPNSNITVGLIKYCNSIYKKELEYCTILISRQQFAQTVQSQLGTLSGTNGIDLISGNSYYKKTSIITKKTENIVIR